jgi:hypothetical protein
VVTICTASLTFNNSTFCPHTVFMCFVWISEQTAIISLYNINWLAFVTETECVYCAVRTGYLYWMKLFQVNILVIWIKKDWKDCGQPEPSKWNRRPRSQCQQFGKPWFFFFLIMVWKLQLIDQLHTPVPTHTGYKVKWFSFLATFPLPLA